MGLIHPNDFRGARFENRDGCDDVFPEVRMRSLIMPPFII
jgi:hypothetical protein